MKASPPGPAIGALGRKRALAQCPNWAIQTAFMGGMSFSSRSLNVWIPERLQCHKWRPLDPLELVRPTHLDK